MQRFKESEYYKLANLQPADQVKAAFDVAIAAEQSLGYRQLARSIWPVRPLADALEKLEIEVLDPGSVKSYCQALADEENRKFAGYRISSNRKHEWEWSAIRQLMNLLTFFRTRYFASPTYEAEEITARWDNLEATWKTTPLEDYRDKIPVHVLRKALSVKEACPEAKFEVYSMVVEHRWETYDPFLIAILGYELYYIEQWDEPKFDL